MSRPDVTHPDLNHAIDAGGDPRMVLLDIVRELVQDVAELIPKYGRHEPGDPLEVVHAHLTLAAAALAPFRP